MQEEDLSSETQTHLEDLGVDFSVEATPAEETIVVVAAVEVGFFAN